MGQYSKEWEAVLDGIEEEHPDDRTEKSVARQQEYLEASKKMIDMISAQVSEEYDVDIDLSWLWDFEHDGTSLSFRERMFAARYSVDLNSKEALKAAGYKYEEDNLHKNNSSANALLRKPHVFAAMVALNQCKMERLRINSDTVVKELAKIAYSNITDVVTWIQGQSGQNQLTIKSMDDIPEEARCAIQEISETVSPNGTRTLKVKMYDKVNALNMMMRHFGMYRDKITVEHKGEVLEELRLARERAKQHRERDIIEGQVVRDDGRPGTGSPFEITQESA